VRFKLVTAGGTGNDQRLEEARMEAARNFANKLWNASRFVLSQVEAGERVPALDPSRRESMPTEDRWILSRLDRLTTNADKLMERFELGEAGREMQEFVWDEFCDWYLEIAKIRMRTGDEASPMPVLVHVLDTCLRLLHPYMPYVTEEIWSGTGDVRSVIAETDAKALIMKAPYPVSNETWLDDAAEREMNVVLDVVRSVRNLRRERNIDAGRWLEAYVVADASIARHAPAIETLARVRPLHFVSDRTDAPSESVASAILSDAQVILPMAGLFDAGAERSKLEKDREQAQAEIGRLEAQLANEKFVNGAKPEVVESVRERLEAAKSRLAGIAARLAELG
jgi:valyl-tRNA synthetase